MQQTDSPCKAKTTREVDNIGPQSHHDRESLSHQLMDDKPTAMSQMGVFSAGLPLPWKVSMFT